MGSQIGWEGKVLALYSGSNGTSIVPLTSSFEVCLRCGLGLRLGRYQVLLGPIPTRFMGLESCHLRWNDLTRILRVLRGKIVILHTEQ